jgi:ABC-type polysaccharide/polyol phosphate export permease
VIASLWAHRRFLVESAVADLRSQYAGSGAGILWHVVYPLAQIAIFTLVFSRIMTVEMPGSSASGGFVLYLCSGLLPWIAFSECVLRGANAFVENAAYLKRLPLPEEVFVAKGALTSALALPVPMLGLAALALAFGRTAELPWLAVPPVLVLWLCFGFGLGLVLASLNVFLRDIGHVLALMLQLWFWMTPIVYLETILPEAARRALDFNPAYPFIGGLHRAIVFGEWPLGTQWTWMVAWAVAAPLVGLLVLGRVRREIRDVL